MTSRFDQEYSLIHSPVGPFSPVAEIDVWIQELTWMSQRWPKNAGITDALADARKLRKLATLKPAAA